MAFDIACLNLETIISKPIEEDNLEHWQKTQRTAKAIYNNWKQMPDKRVTIDGVKYRLVRMIPE